MPHYSLSTASAKPREIRRERWETFAAFLTFAALVALAGATYGALLHGDMHTEIRRHGALRHFFGIMDDSRALARELKDKTRNFTVIAPSDEAFRESGVEFLADDEESAAQDRRIIRIGGGNSYLLQGESYTVRSLVLPHELPPGQTLRLPAANGDIITLSRGKGERMLVNGVPVRDQVVADNGVIYVVDALIYPLPAGEGAEDTAKPGK